MNNCVDEIMKILDTIEYGYKDEYGFNIVNDTNKWDLEFSKFYKLLSPKELLESKCGVCWDQVELERYLFNQYNIDINTYFIYIDDNKGLPSHTFLTFNIDNNIYWFEHSWYTYKGIHKYDNLDSLLDDITNKFIISRQEEIDSNTKYKVYIYKYNRPKYSINCDEFYTYINSQELVRESTI